MVGRVRLTLQLVKEPQVVPSVRLTLQLVVTLRTLCMNCLPKPRAKEDIRISGCLGVAYMEWCLVCFAFLHCLLLDGLDWIA